MKEKKKEVVTTKGEGEKVVEQAVVVEAEKLAAEAEKQRLAAEAEKQRAEQERKAVEEQRAREVQERKAVEEQKAKEAKDFRVEEGLVSPISPQQPALHPRPPVVQAEVAQQPPVPPPPATAVAAEAVVSKKEIEGQIVEAEKSMGGEIEKAQGKVNEVTGGE